MSFQRACSLNDVAAGEGLSVDIISGDRVVDIAIIRDEDGRWHAIDDKCTHGDVSLAEGEVEGNVVECWAHGATFDLDTGKQSLPAVSPVQVYPVEIRESEVFVDVDAHL
ncbi:MAG: non-heme iron oxygenase ferredoxin subunit [Actinomycetaceae bacterium]|nr:non-heme iron oxygenase ferredoxin subunit [Actinomycetaceae bacterium]